MYFLDYDPFYFLPSDLDRLVAAIRAGYKFIHVTGPAGTGKTTVIKGIKETLQPSYSVIVTAPTGIAALQVGGATIHRTFCLPSRVLDRKTTGTRGPCNSDVKHILIIDEISMVRADLLDAIDRTLRHTGRSQEPFGGLTVVAVGDPAQLPPVLTPEESVPYYALGYKSRHFFSARILERVKIFHVCLETVYRQQDPNFLKLLHNVRLARDLDSSLPEINRRVITAFADSEERVTLTTTNRIADCTNKDKLSELPGELVEYLGSFEGSFLADFGGRLPAPMHLALKLGARVILTQNDPNGRWVNGSVGTVRALTPNIVKVELDAFGTTVGVERAIWNSRRYERDRDTGQFAIITTGAYIQFPLSLAWAITIHKSQGMTLDRVRIDLGDRAFDYGQSYVALSRCRSLDGIALSRPIRADDVRLDPAVVSFYRSLRERSFALACNS